MLPMRSTSQLGFPMFVSISAKALQQRHLRYGEFIEECATIKIEEKVKRKKKV